MRHTGLKYQSALQLLDEVTSARGAYSSHYAYVRATAHSLCDSGIRVLTCSVHNGWRAPLSIFVPADAPWMLFWRSRYPSPGWQFVDFRARSGYWHHRPLGGLDPVPEPAQLSSELVDVLACGPQPGRPPWRFGEYPRELPSVGIDELLKRYKRSILPYLDHVHIRSEEHSRVAQRVRVSHAQ